MTNKTRYALVAEHGGKSYIQFRSSDYYDRNRLSVNGVTDLPKAPGSDEFVVFDGVVERVELIVPAKRITTKYLLRDDLKGASKPDVISVDEYGRLKESDQALYRGAIEDIPQSAEPVEFMIQHENGPPKQLPQGVVCTDKNYYLRFPSFWHLGPVRAKAGYVLWRLAHAFRALIAENPYIQHSSDWLSERKIGEILGSTWDKGFFINVAPMTVNGITVKPEKISTFFTTDKKDHGLTYGVVVPEIDGDCLEDLERKITAYIDATMKPHRSWVQPDKCPCCQRRFVKKKA